MGAGVSKPTEPTPGFESLSREGAVRDLHNRMLKLKEDIRSLTTAEKLRLAADFADLGDDVHPSLAREVARLALAELEKSA